MCGMPSVFFCTAAWRRAPALPLASVYLLRAIPRKMVKAWGSYWMIGCAPSVGASFSFWFRISMSAGAKPIKARVVQSAMPIRNHTMSARK